MYLVVFFKIPDIFLTTFSHIFNKSLKTYTQFVDIYEKFKTSFNSYPVFLLNVIFYNIQFFYSSLNYSLYEQKKIDLEMGNICLIHVRKKPTR